MMGALILSAEEAVHKGKSSSWVIDVNKMI